MDEQIIRQKKMQEIRRQLIGMGIINYVAQGGGNVHIHYEKESGPYDMQPSAMQTPMMSAEKFTMSRDEFKAYMLKKMLEEQS